MSLAPDIPSSSPSRPQTALPPRRSESTDPDLVAQAARGGPVVGVARRRPSSMTSSFVTRSLNGLEGE